MYILKSFNEYFSAEHSRLLSLWRAVVAFRRQFGEMKTATGAGHVASPVRHHPRLTQHAQRLSEPQRQHEEHRHTDTGKYVHSKKSRSKFSHLHRTGKGNHIVVIWHDITFCCKSRSKYTHVFPIRS